MYVRPEPDVTWFVNNTKIVASDSRFEFDPNRQTYLKIKDFKKSLEGRYKCVLNNSEGNDTTATDVLLKYTGKFLCFLFSVTSFIYKSFDLSYFIDYIILTNKVLT